MRDDEIFYRFTPFIQDYIYQNGWKDLREVQIAAAKAIFETDKNLLISSSTASGKTEAAFFPIISLMCEDMPKSVGAPDPCPSRQPADHGLLLHPAL